jgi:aldose 1-epimerase
LQNKDLPEDLDDPHQIDPDHVGYDAEMEDDAHDDKDTYENEVDVDADDDHDDDDHDHDGDDDDDEAVAGSSQ